MSRTKLKNLYLDEYIETNGSVVEVSSNFSSGTEIATIKVNGQPTVIYAPSAATGIDETKLSDYCKTSALISYLTKTSADAIYQPKGDYLTSHQSLSNYLTKISADNIYQPKGDYLISDDLSDYAKHNWIETNFLSIGATISSLEVHHLSVVRNLMVGNENEAYGNHSLIVGTNNQSGSRGFYYKAIDTGNKLIYLCKEFPGFDSRAQFQLNETGDKLLNLWHEYDVPFISSSVENCANKNLLMPDFDISASGLLSDELIGEVLTLVNVAKIPGHRCCRIKNILSGSVIEYDNVSNSFLNANDGFQMTRYNKLDPKTGKPEIDYDDYTCVLADRPDIGIRDSISENVYVVGIGNTANGREAFVAGKNNICDGNYSMAVGRETSAVGYISHSEGYQTLASGAYSHAEGRSTTASNTGTHAEGISSTATGYGSHAEGRQTSAVGAYSHADGALTKAYGDYSHAEGRYCIANGIGSHADGVFADTRVTDANAYAWSGISSAVHLNDKTANHYQSHGTGTFNVNPIGGLDGFYIGENSLCAIISGLINSIPTSVIPENQPAGYAAPYPNDNKDFRHSPIISAHITNGGDTATVIPGKWTLIDNKYTYRLINVKEGDLVEIERFNNGDLSAQKIIIYPLSAYPIPVNNENAPFDRSCTWAVGDLPGQTGVCYLSGQCLPPGGKTYIRHRAQLPIQKNTKYLMIGRTYNTDRPVPMQKLTINGQSLLDYSELRSSTINQFNRSSQHILSKISLSATSDGSVWTPNDNYSMSHMIPCRTNDVMVVSKRNSASNVAIRSIEYFDKNFNLLSYSCQTSGSPINGFQVFATNINGRDTLSARNTIQNCEYVRIGYNRNTNNTETKPDGNPDGTTNSTIFQVEHQYFTPEPHPDKLVPYLATTSEPVKIAPQFEGKTILFGGDSITRHDITSASTNPSEATKGYVHYICDDLRCQYVNGGNGGDTLALSSTGIADYNSRTRTSIIDELETSTWKNARPDMIVIMIGTNDWNYAWSEFGNIDGTDKERNNFCGAARCLCHELQVRYPGIPVVFCTPIKRWQKRRDDRPCYDQENARGKTLEDYAEALKTICRGVPGFKVIDLYNEWPVDPKILEHYDKFIPDGSHPSNEGHRLIANCIVSHLKNMIV